MNSLKIYFGNVALLFTMLLIVELIGSSLISLGLFLYSLLIENITAISALTFSAGKWLQMFKWFLVTCIPGSFGCGFLATAWNDNEFFITIKEKDE